MQRHKGGALVALALVLLVGILAACGTASVAQQAGAGGAGTANPTRAPTASVAATAAETTPEPTIEASPSAQPGLPTVQGSGLLVEASPTAPSAPSPPANADNASLRQVQFFVPTITCPGCAARIKRNAQKDPGVVSTEVVLETQEVTVTYDPAKTDPDKIAEAIRAGGDRVIPQ